VYWNDLTPGEWEELRSASWLGDPEIRHYVNLQIAGDRNLWTLDWLERRHAALFPLRRTVVVGCGTGALERDLLSRNLTERVVAIDLAGEAVAEARQLAAAAGFSERIDYLVGDAREWLQGQSVGTLPAVYFHGSLHHFDRIPETLELVRSRLAPDGLLVADEYVGPSMGQWNALLLLPANIAYWLLPLAVRRTHIVRAPRNPDDPTEAICSAEIVPAIERSFEVVDRRDSGGNLLSLVYPSLRRDSAPGGPHARAVRRLIRLERGFRILTGRFRRSFYTVIVARPRAAGRRQPEARGAGECAGLSA